MKKVKRILIAGAIILSGAGTAAAGNGEVLWYLVGSDYRNITASTGDGGTVTAGELGVTDARVRYESADGSSLGYLSLFSVNEDGSVSVYDGSNGLGAEHGTGLPASYFGDLGPLSGTSYNFVLELGNWENGSWTRTSMESEKVSYQALVDDNHITVWEKTAPSYGTPWNPGGYSVVPEPSGGLLMLLGAALLALRRKREEN